MRLRVNAFTVKTKIVGDTVNEFTLAFLHWLEAEAFLHHIRCEQAQRFFLLVRPRHVLKIHVESRF